MSPRIKAREEETGGTEARQRILGAALSAFMEGGYAQTSTLEIATRARVSKRELYALFGNKEAMLVACITERAQRLKAPADLPELRDRKILTEVLTAFGTRLLTETTDPVVVGVFRLAISETVHAPKVAQALDTIARKPTRDALRAIMANAKSAGLVVGDPGMTRTCDLRFRKPSLYPAELRDRTEISTTYNEAPIPLTSFWHLRCLSGLIR